MSAEWWENPEAGSTDASAVRHAPDDHNYHIPDDTLRGKIGGGRVRDFATIPAAFNNGKSKGFDPTVAGPIHVDPDAPDGGVIFDAASVDKSMLDRAVASARFPHQALYSLAIAPGKLTKQAAPAQYGAHGVQVDHGRNPLMPSAYVTPHMAADHGGSVATYSYRAQEDQMSALPPLNSLPPLAQPQQAQPAPLNYGAAPVSQPTPVPIPQPQAAPVSYPQQPAGYPTQPQMVGGYPQPTYYQPPAAYMPPPPPQADPQMLALMQSMQQQINNLSRNQQASELPPTTGMSPNPLPPRRAVATLPVGRQPPGWEPSRQPVAVPDDEDDPDVRPIRKRVLRDKVSNEIIREEEEPEVARPAAKQTRQRLRDYEDSLQEPEAVITGFETLELPFVTGPVAEKAKKPVVIEIPGQGRHSARFHDVIIDSTCIVLVYDTRYEDGQQYEPPELGETPIILHLPYLRPEKKQERYVVTSMGFKFAFGVFDCVVLVRIDDTQLTEVDE